MPGQSLGEFADKMNEIMQVLAREFHRHQTLEFLRTKLTIPQFIILDYLNRGCESSMTDIAKHLYVTTAAVTGVVDRIVRGGYVRRVRDPGDRRIVRVALTEKGIKVVSTIGRHRRELTIKIFSMISQSERVKYLEILTHIKTHLTEQEP